jgi:hypothetical protein
MAEEALAVLNSLEALHALEFSLPEVLAWSIPVLRCGEPTRVGAALTTLSAVRDWHGRLLNEKMRLVVVRRLCEALAARSEAEVEAFARRLLSMAEPGLRDVTAVAIVALDLTAELLPLLSEALTLLRPHLQKRVQRFIAALSQPAAAVGEGPAAALRLLDKEVLTVEERLERIRLMAALEPAQRSTLFPELPAPAELLFALLQETDGGCSASLEEDWVKELLSWPRSRAWLMAFAAREPHHYLSYLILGAAGPECEGLIVLLQRRLAKRNAAPSDRERWVETLGRIASGPGAPACALVLQVFLNARESVATRMVAARALWALGVRGLPAADVAPALRDRSATLRSWALLLAGELPEELLLPLREEASPLVRWALSRRSPGQ